MFSNSDFETSTSNVRQNLVEINKLKSKTLVSRQVDFDHFGVVVFTEVRCSGMFNNANTK